MGGLEFFMVWVLGLGCFWSGGFFEVSPPSSVGIHSKQASLKSDNSLGFHLGVVEGQK